MKRVIAYLNQFFGQIGGEDQADYPPTLFEGPVGPIKQLEQGIDATITHTIVCGDNFFGEHTEESIERILSLLDGLEFDLFLAGPAFQAGRYGVACGTICKAVQQRYSKPALTCMHEENPGVEMFGQDVLIVRGHNSAAKMRKDLAAVSALANTILAGKPLPCAQEGGYFPRGIRHQAWPDGEACAADRMVDMLLKKLAKEPYQTELSIPEVDPIEIAKPIEDLAHARIALITSGGIVPQENPDHIQSASATRWGRYDISGLDRLSAPEYKTIHAGFDPAAANEDPNRILPLDVMRQMEKEGVYGSLHPYFYTTVGTGTSQRDAARMANEIIPYLKKDKVDGLIMVST